MNGNVRKMVLIALLTALTCVGTMVIHIPVPATQGYINVGDSMIILASALLGPFGGLFAGGVGSALADIFLGSAHWAPFTLVIKGVEGLVMAYIFGKSYQMERKFGARLIVGMVVGVLVMVLGYFLASCVIYSVPAAAASIPENLIQAGASFVIGLALLGVFKKIPLKWD